ncbi:SMP-30/gluconolactonase/LRE family protein [Pseudorhodoferax sp.]|uniref:SMP-30/gluconolactonase/LRE family protein n=1 Tax=Pseudorhodoferax sp. TaxID=1993553 RepID=UPI002DD66568|nr:SMP-30/gluconolactonase/LRE family protein [Pseudorhodoferax sp.]
MSAAADGLPPWQPLPGVPPSRLGESPLWLGDEGVLLWVDIPGRQLNEWRAADGRWCHWALPAEAGCIAPLPGGALLLAMRDGLFRFERRSGERIRLAEPPYDAAEQRFNDGKADPQGRLWVGTIHEPREPAAAALYRWADGRLERVAGDVTVSNGLAWSPDGRRMYWSDTKAHRVDMLDFDPGDGSVAQRRPFVQFAPKPADGRPAAYGGRPDGAAVDAEGAYWVAMFEGQRLLRLSPAGAVLAELPLPVRCPTMPCFGGPDLRTLFVTTSGDRPPEERAAQPLAGCVLMRRVDVPGLPVNYVRP